MAVSQTLLVLFAIMVVVIAIGSRRPIILGWLMCFVAPWQGLDVDIGLRVTAFRLVAACTLVLVIIDSRLPLARWWRRLSKGGRLFVVYALLWSFLQILVLPEATVGGGVLRAPVARAVAQIAMFTLSLTPMLLLTAYVNYWWQLRRAATVYVISVVVLAAIGWIQLLMWHHTGHNPFPIGIVGAILTGDDILLRDALFTFQGSTVYRMSSLGGEPKNLGQSFAIALILIQSVRRYAGWSPGSIALWLFLAVSLIATWSTSAIYIFVIGSVALIVLRRGESPITGPFSGIYPSRVAMLLLAGACFGMIGLERGESALGQLETGNPLVNVLEERTLDRQLLEDFDVAILRFLLDQPQHAVFGVGLGNAHLHANPYLPRYSREYAEGTAFAAKSGFLQLISELGIAGFVLFLVFAWGEIRLLGVMQCGRLGGECAILTAFSLVMTLLYLARGGYVEPQFYLTLGSVMAARGFLRAAGHRQGPIRAPVVHARVGT